MPVSEARPVNVAQEEESVASEDDEEDSRPLSQSLKKPVVTSSPVPARDQVRKDEGKRKMSGEGAAVVRSYSTRGTERKLLNNVMKASRQKHVYKKRLSRTTVVEEDIPEDQTVEVVEEPEIDWTESEDEEGNLSQGPNRVKDSKHKKKESTKGKKCDPAFTQGPGSQLKKTKTEKILTKGPEKQSASKSKGVEWESV